MEEKVSRRRIEIPNPLPFLPPIVIEIPEEIKLKFDSISLMPDLPLPRLTITLKVDDPETEDEPIEIAFGMLDEARKYIKEANPVQASEKLYKASEEVIKILAKRHKIPEYEEAIKKGRWTRDLLFKTARRLSETFPEVFDYWDHAWTLHVEGFHEAKLDIEEVSARAKAVNQLVKLVKR